VSNRSPGENAPEHKKHGWFLWITLLEVLVLAVLIFMAVRQMKPSGDGEDEQAETIELVTELSNVPDDETETETERERYVPRPDISEQILTVNPYSRPGDKIKSLNYIVVHYLANPMTTAQQNHDYFESLKDLQDTYMSANYVIGIEGEIIHCVPDDEVAYASNQANNYSISIENCHVDESGELTGATYTSLVHLLAYLVDQYDLTVHQIIRHYDVTGKICPKYFVENPDAWEQLRDDVEAYMEECYAAYIGESVTEAVTESAGEAVSEAVHTPAAPAGEAADEDASEAVSEQASEVPS